MMRPLKSRRPAASTKVDLPSNEANILDHWFQRQFEKVQRLIQTGIDEGARLVAGGVGRPKV